MKVNVLSAYQTNAEEFFSKVLDWKTDLILDVRLRDNNQLAGFTKKDDLAYFARAIAQADFAHDIEYSPSKDLLAKYLDGGMPYEEYFAEYKAELDSRGAISDFFKKYGKYNSIAIVGTATKKRRSHAEELQDILMSTGKVNS